MELKQLDITGEKNGPQPQLHTLYKSELKMDHGLKCKTIGLLEKNTEENLQDLGLGRGFLDLTPKAR